MLSSPVALPVESARMLVLISAWVMGVSQSSEVWVGVGGFSLKYWEHENWVSWGLSLESLSLYRFWKNVVSSSRLTCWSGSSHLAFDLRSLRMAHHPGVISC